MLAASPLYRCWGPIAVDDFVSGDGPLEGVKVVELSMYVQGPVAGLTLGALGADVVKIEQVGKADFIRSFGGVFGVTFDDRGRDWMYSSVNRNKRAIALDITSEAGRPVFERMIEGADVFVTNLRESGLARFGADADTLLEINPRLVYGRGGGFALDGPLAEELCQDTVGMAYAGFMDGTSPSEVPNYPPGSLSDILTGTNIASGVMAGLVKRATTGKGCVVGTSQTQALLWLQLQTVGVVANVGQRFDRFDHSTANPLFTVYEASDRWIAIAAVQDAQWIEIAEAVALGHLLEDPRFESIDAVQAHQEEFRAIFSAHLKTDTAEHWCGALRDTSAWVGPVNQLQDLAADENILANDYLATFPDGFVAPPTPFDIDGFKGVRGTAAEYGEHTDELLAEYGYSDDEILDLRINGAVW